MLQLCVLLLLAIRLVVGDSALNLPKPTPPKASTVSKRCTVTPLGGRKDDVPQILKAFDECNNGGTVVFPEGQTFNIATRLNPVIYDVTVEWRGSWLVSHEKWPRLR